MKKVLICCVLFFSISCKTQSVKETSQLKVTKIKDNIYVLKGKGGNIGLVTSKDRTLMIDDKFANLTESINKIILKYTKIPVGIILNTHWHGDHTGGNENYGKAGAVIVAHENVRKIMAKPFSYKLRDKEVPASKDSAIPMITFKKDLVIHIGKETLQIFHVPNGHTNGDSIIFFPNSNVFHMGDNFFNGFYPFIDSESGGTISGMIRAGERVLKMSNKKTVIIPGHGPITDKKRLLEYIKMLKQVKEIVKNYIKEEKSIQEIIELKPLAHLEKKWGGGFMNSEKFLTFVHYAMTK